MNGRVLGLLLRLDVLAVVGFSGRARETDLEHFEARILPLLEERGLRAAALARDRVERERRRAALLLLAATGGEMARRARLHLGGRALRKDDPRLHAFVKEFKTPETRASIETRLPAFIPAW